MTLMGGAILALQWRGQREATGQPGANPQIPPQYGSGPETRPREAEIASNRGLEGRGEYV